MEPHLVAAFFINMAQNIKPGFKGQFFSINFSFLSLIIQVENYEAV